MIGQIHSGPNPILAPIIYDYLRLYSLIDCFSGTFSERVFFGTISAGMLRSQLSFLQGIGLRFENLRDQGLNHRLDFLSLSAGCTGSDGTTDKAVAPKPEQIANDQ